MSALTALCGGAPSPVPRNPSRLLATQMQLRPNDFIFIEEQPITKWNRVVSQFIPSLFNQVAQVADGL